LCVVLELNIGAENFFELKVVRSTAARHHHHLSTLELITQRCASAVLAPAVAC
jgi:hypothetical protein